MPEQCGGNRKAGEQQGTQPCEEACGHEKLADELGKDGGIGENRRPWQSIAPDLLDARTPMPHER